MCARHDNSASWRSHVTRSCNFSQGLIWLVFTPANQHVRMKQPQHRLQWPCQIDGTHSPSGCLLSMLQSRITKCLLGDVCSSKLEGLIDWLVLRGRVELHSWQIKPPAPHWHAPPSCPLHGPLPAQPQPFTCQLHYLQHVVNVSYLVNNICYHSYYGCNLIILVNGCSGDM